MRRNLTPQESETPFLRLLGDSTDDEFEEEAIGNNIESEDESKEHVTSIKESKKRSLTVQEGLPLLRALTTQAYDFAVFGCVSSIIANLFFSDQSGNAAIAESFLVFGSAFIMKPFGASLFRFMRGKYGKKKAFVSNLLITGIATTAIACLPTYDAIGSAATFLLVFFRIIQGLATGIEPKNLLKRTLKYKDKRHWGFYSSNMLLFGKFGSFTGCLLGYFLRKYLTKDEMQDWGWRLLFIFGLKLVFPAIYVIWFAKEKVLDETSSIIIAERIFHVDNHWAFVSSLLMLNFNAVFNLSFTFMSTYFNDLVDEPLDECFLINALSIGISVCLFSPLAGMASDLFGRIPCMIAGIIGISCFGPLTLYVASIGRPFTTFFSQCALGSSFSFYSVSMFVWLVENSPAQIKLTSTAFTLTLLSSSIGGLIPSLAVLMVDYIGITSPGIIYLFLSLLTLIGLYMKPHDDESSSIVNDELYLASS